MIAIFGTHLQKDDGFQVGKRAKNDLKLPISVCHAGDFWYIGIK